jgi:[citrate (pro-3S)-lyase] ligase
MEVLPKFGIEIKLIERVQTNGRAISASDVRNMIREGKEEYLSGLLPEVTLEFLKTDRGREIIENIKRSDSPH